MISILLNSVARIILPPALLIAAYLLFRGHNLPGGGFIAGLLTAAAFVLQYVAAGREQVARSLPVRSDLLIALGLALAALTGIGAQMRRLSVPHQHLRPSRRARAGRVRGPRPPSSSTSASIWW